jgi:uncharacterized cysteine cluster protein YcgN (CxxCxxCC family)
VWGINSNRRALNQNYDDSEYKGWMGLCEGCGKQTYLRFFPSNNTPIKMIYDYKNDFYYQ